MIQQEGYEAVLILLTFVLYEEQINNIHFYIFIIDYSNGCDFYIVNIPFVFSEIICDPPLIPNGVYRPELSKYRGQDKITYECKKCFIPEIHGTDATCTRDGWAPVPRCACTFHSYLDLLLNCYISFS